MKNENTINTQYSVMSYGEARQIVVLGQFDGIFHKLLSIKY